MRWITREKVKVDRVACPWLIKKFIDPVAEFIFLPYDTDWSAIRDGIVYDVPHCELGHHGEEVSFDAILKKYSLADPAIAASGGDRARGRFASGQSASGRRRSALDCPGVQRPWPQRSRDSGARIHRL